MRELKRLAALLLALVLVFSMTACGGSMEETVTQLVQGNLDELYLGKFDESYLELVSATEEECEQSYLEGLEIEAEYFAYYFNVEYLTDELKADIVELYKEIYSHSKFTVNPATKLDDDTYAVKVQISPINIFDLVLQAESEGAMDDFYNKYATVDINAMTDEEYKAYDTEWAYAIIDLCYEQLPNVGYMDEQSIAVQVTKDTDGLWCITDNDMGTIDELIIYYP